MDLEKRIMLKGKCLKADAVLYRILLMFLIGFTACDNKEVDVYLTELKAERKENNKYFAGKGSPLLEEDRAEFVSLNFYPINKSFKVSCDFERIQQLDTVVMATSTEREVTMLDYGIYHFTLGEKKASLHGYYNIEDPDSTLFIPFNDLTNGEETYGGGRYLDVPIPESNKASLDFNKAYNPYCAYNYKYSCPVPPEVNKLSLAIIAGEKVFH